jgi:4-hydroxyphenylpyruvate dioxygenase
MKFENQGFDHVEFILNRIAPMSAKYLRMGFEKVGESRAKGLKREVYAQGFVRIILSEPVAGDTSAESTEAVKFLRAQDEGICVLAVDVADPAAAFRESVAKGAKPALAPVTYETPQGRVTRAEIWTPGLVRYAFISRTAKPGQPTPGLFDDGLVIDRFESPSPFGVRVIDHLTNNVSIGEMKKWVDWYQQIFDFKIIRHFDIRTGRTGLTSDAVQSQDGKITVPVNEATEPESQVQEFVTRFKGPGVQHLALLTTDIQDTVKRLKEEEFGFLTVPHSYYEAVPTRVKGVTEDLAKLEDLNILLDSEGEGYLLQIFTAEILGPFFFEFIQRKGNKGFGEGNFRALFEAIERDQIKRGTLTA